MNVSNVSPLATSYPTPGPSIFQQTGQDFRALQNALQSGDLSSAQQAFASLQKDLQPAAGAAGSSSASPWSQNNPLGKDFQALQSALQSGDLSGAQSAFASVKQDLQSAGAARGHHHHHHKSSSAARSGTQTSDSTSTSAVSATTGSLLNIQA